MAEIIDRIIENLKSDNRRLTAELKEMTAKYKEWREKAEAISAIHTCAMDKASRIEAERLVKREMAKKGFTVVP